MGAKLEYFTLEQVQKISAALRELPPAHQTRTVFSKREVVYALEKEIIRLQKRGYTVKEIAGILEQHGLRVAVATLRGYLYEKKRKLEKDRRDASKGGQNGVVKGAKVSKVRKGGNNSFAVSPDSKNL